MQPHLPSARPAGLRRFDLKVVTLALALLGPGPATAQAPQDAAQHNTRSSSATHANDARRRPVRTLATPCQGRDDTALLQAALSTLTSGETLQLPAGTCRYSAVLRLDNKRDIEVAGAGRDATLLLAGNPRRSSLVVHRSRGVVLRDFSLRAERQITRQDTAEARGLYAEHSQQLEVHDLRVAGISGAGMLLWDVQNAHLHHNHVHDTLADGIHVTGGARDILIAHNLAERTGDDGFASVSYLREQARFGLNQRITIHDNVSIDSWASGVTVEGSTDVSVTGNRIESSGVAGIRIAAIASEWNTAAVSQVEVIDNVLIGARTRSNIDHAAIMVFADSAKVSRVNLRGNRIDVPRTADAVRIRGNPGFDHLASEITVRDTTITDRRGQVKSCVTVGAAAERVSVASNRLNGQTCR